jgi:hypothetical protein
VQDADLFPFLAIFRDLLAVFPKRLDENEINVMAKSYFTALRRFSVPEIQAGADAWMQRGKFFPKPAEWRESIPRASRDAIVLSPINESEAAEYLAAERKGWEGEPCDCRMCQSAGVTHRFLRYVPEVDGYGLNAKGLIGTRTIVRGHWAHGEELARWYEAHDAFWADFRALVTRLSMPSARTAAEPEPVVEAEPELIEEQAS